MFINSAPIRFEIEQFVGNAPHGLERHKYDDSLMYFLLLLRNGKLVGVEDIVYYGNSQTPNGAAKWIGVFNVDDEFFVDFSKLAKEVDSIIITAFEQEYPSSGVPEIGNATFRVSLFEFESESIFALYDAYCVGPCLWCDIMRMCKTGGAWQFVVPGDRLGESLLEDFIGK